ncbi:MAG: hypothetical protein JWL91_2765 [Sphingomonas bacterium]|nr:hypothetical protein [Sphingomonas bacterium]MDB5690889.1 hypothetical protein [Sphingomonas bacterium]
MRRRRRPSLLAGAILCLAAMPVSARETISVHGGWAAFRDDGPRRCFAVAEPAQKLKAHGWRPFAAVSVLPGAGTRGQINIRLRYRKLRGAPVFLSIGGRRFRLVAGGSDAWAPDAAQDAAIVAAMRSAPSMSIETRARDGRAFADVYRLRGAATAIDAAALACLPPR